MCWSVQVVENIILFVLVLDALLKEMAKPCNKAKHFRGDKLSSKYFTVTNMLNLISSRPIEIFNPSVTLTLSDSQY